MSQEVPARELEAPVRFQLFVAGESPRSRRAIENLDRLVKGAVGLVHVEVIDVLTHPERAEEERILATPTLIKDWPLPKRRVTGDLSDAERVLRALGPLPEASSETEMPS